MAASRTVSSRVATQGDIDRSQRVQDRGIRQEFENVNKKLDEQRSYIDERFTEQRVYVDDRFQQVDDRFQQVDDRFQDLEVLIKNSRATSSWHDIHPVRVLDSHRQSLIPANFPNKVVKFWRLQRPRHQRQLAGLLRFYRIRAAGLTASTLDDDDDDTGSESSSEDSPESPLALEEAVEANPEFALARLAAHLGLDFESIHHNMGLGEQIQAEKIEQKAKRERSEQDNDDAEPSKKQASSDDVPLALVARPKKAKQKASVQARASPVSSPSTQTTEPFSHTPSIIEGILRRAKYGV
jgi:hypothetical protein